MADIARPPAGGGLGVFPTVGREGVVGRAGVARGDHGDETMTSGSFDRSDNDSATRPASRRGGPVSAPLGLLWRHRSLLLHTTVNDIRARFAGSLLGLAWLVFYPLLFLGTYALVYIFVFKVRFALFDSNEYVVLIFCGLIPFLGFAEALGTGVSSVTSNAGLIKNTLYPIELIPVKAVLASQCTQVVGTFMLLAAVGLLGRLTWWALLLPVVWLLQLMFTAGVIWILGSLNVIARDLQNIVGIMTLILMMASPIAWTIEMIPPNIRPIMGLNPLYYMIYSYQEILMRGRWPQGGVLWVLAALAVVSFFGGYWFFGRLKRVFVDNV
jgi:lipopolysaccharide transport system permease protein